MSDKKGALPIQTIREMKKSGFIRGGLDENIKPASLDLSLSDEIYEVDGVFLPYPNEIIREVVSRVNATKVSIADPLRVNKTYLIRLNEKIQLPEGVYAYCNPKSSTGRLDMHVRLMADKVARYDTLTQAGSSGELWVSVIPRSFDVLLFEGLCLNQLRFFNKDTRFTEAELQMELSKTSLIWNESGAIIYADLRTKDADGSLLLGLDINGETIGYEAIQTDVVIDVSRIGSYEYSDFFIPVVKDKDDLLYLKRDTFYILSTKERLKIPPYLACEMIPMDERTGEFRSHYAGFIDPGWGWGKDGEGEGRPITLEVRPFEDMIVRQDQPIGKVVFERLTDVPEQQYDDIGSNYISQKGPKLAKQFKS